MVSFDYQKYIISKINEVYLQVKISLNFPIAHESKKFIDQNTKLTNWSQVIEFKNIVLNSIDEELKNHKKSYSLEQHNIFNRWLNEINSWIIIFSNFYELYQWVLFEPNNDNWKILLIINQQLYIQTIVNLYGKYHLSFLEFKNQRIIEIIKSDFDKNLLDLDFNEILKLENQFINCYFGDLKLLKNQELINQEQNSFLIELNRNVSLLKNLIEITSKIIIENNHLDFNI